jgi:NAD-dependent deacetylase
MGKLIVFSGAGLSAESGLSTFRSLDGLWANHSYDEVCNLDTWQANYEAVHRFHNDLRAMVGAAIPNDAHRRIAKWQRVYDTVIFTQNIDDLLERAGCVHVVHLHGLAQEMECLACRHVWNIGYQAWQTDDCCPKANCNSREDVKPNVVFFNEIAPNYRFFKRAFFALEYDDVVLVTGTSSQVINVGRYLSGQPGYKIFNALEPSATPEVYDEAILLPATQALPLIDLILQRRFRNTSYRWNS